jgi:hypothetical protein
MGMGCEVEDGHEYRSFEGDENGNETLGDRVQMVRIISDPCRQHPCNELRWTPSAAFQQEPTPIDDPQTINRYHERACSFAARGDATKRVMFPQPVNLSSSNNLLDNLSYKHLP